MGKFALPVKRKENEVKEEVKRNWFWKVGGGHLGGGSRWGRWRRGKSLI